MGKPSTFGMIQEIIKKVKNEEIVKSLNLVNCFNCNRAITQVFNFFWLGSDNVIKL